MAKLTDKQELFISHYLTCWNATEAARRAGYQGDSASLAVIGHENLRKLNIAQRVSERISEVAMSADEVLLRLARHARGTFEPFLYQGEMLKGEAPKLDLSTEEARANIDIVRKIKTKSIMKISSHSNGSETGDNGATEATEIVETEVELYDAQSALEKLGRHHKLFTDRTEIAGELKIERKAEELHDDELATIAARGS